MIPRIKTFQVKNYKSLASVSVDLEPLTIFVGANGSGKSNLLDALQFLGECVTGQVDIAVRSRGGLHEILSRRERRPWISFDRGRNFEDQRKQIQNQAANVACLGFRLALELDEGDEAEYVFQLSGLGPWAPVVMRERCEIRRKGQEPDVFEAKFGRLTVPIDGMAPAIMADRLALALASATEKFRSIFNFIQLFQFYSIIPAFLRAEQVPDPGYVLYPDGSNAAAVLTTLQVHDAHSYAVVLDYLSEFVPGLKKVSAIPVGTRETIEFVQDIEAGEPVSFSALNMSDGTLRTLGLLLSVYQPSKPSVLAIEEPELAVHPALAEVLFEILRNASDDRQVLVTTHSADILDQKDVRDDQIRVVYWDKGQTRVAPPSGPDRQAIRERLYSAGELMRVGQLDADRADADQPESGDDYFPSIEATE